MKTIKTNIKSPQSPHQMAEKVKMVHQRGLRDKQISKNRNSQLVPKDESPTPDTSNTTNRLCSSFQSYKVPGYRSVVSSSGEMPMETEEERRGSDQLQANLNNSGRTAKNSNIINIKRDHHHHVKQQQVLGEFFFNNNYGCLQNIESNLAPSSRLINNKQQAPISAPSEKIPIRPCCLTEDTFLVEEEQELPENGRSSHPECIHLTPYRQSIDHIANRQNINQNVQTCQIVDKQKQQHNYTQLQLQIQKKVVLTLGKYSIFNHILGEGASCTVYDGRDDETHQHVAIKHIRSGLDNETYVLNKVVSDYVVKRIDELTFNKQTFLVLEKCEGTLRDIVDRISLKTALTYYHQLLLGVRCLQSHFLIHLDLKLENILVHESGKIKISDFGFTKYLGGKYFEHELSGRKFGTEATMAPQILFAQQSRIFYSRKCDIYSLGVILHELVYKCHPFDRKRNRFRDNNRVTVQQSIHEVQQILKGTLEFCPKKRFEIDQLIKEFYKGFGKYLNLELSNLVNPVPLDNSILQMEMDRNQLVHPQYARNTQTAVSNQRRKRFISKIRETHETIEEEHKYKQSKQSPSQSRWVLENLRSLSGTSSCFLVAKMLIVAIFLISLCFLKPIYGSR